MLGRVPEKRGNFNLQPTMGSRSLGARAIAPAATFDLWIDPLQAASATQAETLYLTGARWRRRTWVERRYLGSLEEALRRVSSNSGRIQLVDPPSKVRPGAGTARLARRSRSTSHTVRPLRDRPGQPFRPCRRVATTRRPVAAYNPLSTRAARAGEARLIDECQAGAGRRAVVDRPLPGGRALTSSDHRAQDPRDRALRAALPRPRRAPHRRRPVPRRRGPRRSSSTPSTRSSRRASKRDVERPPAGIARPPGGAPSGPLRSDRRDRPAGPQNALVAAGALPRCG